LQLHSVIRFVGQSSALPDLLQQMDIECQVPLGLQLLEAQLVQLAFHKEQVCTCE